MFLNIHTLQVYGYTHSVALTSPDGLNAAIGEGNPQRSDVATVVHVDIADLLKGNAKGLSHMFHHCLNNKRSRHRPYVRGSTALQYSSHMQSFTEHHC